MGRILGLFVLIALALYIAAIADCLGGEHEPRRFNRRLWVAIILLLPVAGGIAWFVSGRPRPAKPGRRRTATAPDDDPDFLADLERRLREDNDGKLGCDRVTKPLAAQPRASLLRPLCDGTPRTDFASAASPSFAGRTAPCVPRHAAASPPPPPPSRPRWP